MVQVEKLAALFGLPIQYQSRCRHIQMNAIHAEKFSRDFDLKELSMNRFITAIAIASTLFFASGCADSGKSNTAATQANHSMGENHHSEPMTGEMSTDNNTGGHHNHHSHGDTANTATATTQAGITISTAIKVNQTVPFVITVADNAGNAIANFETFQEKLMHLIVVSNDLEFFSHLHPSYQENGRFAGELTFPQSGNYTLFADYKPAGQTEQISVLKAQIPGTSSAASPPDLTRTKTWENTQVNLSFSAPSIKAGEAVTITFEIQDQATNQLVTDLQPYLGEKGHLVIVQQASELTNQHYIHAHALGNAPTGKVQFQTQFPETGLYKMWGQFNRNGEIITANFWVDVTE